MNSGVQIRSNAKPGKNGRVHGYQCEIEPLNRNRFWTAGIYDEGRRGWLYPKKNDAELIKKFAATGKEVTKAKGWNKVRIECKGDSIKTWLNGELRADLKDDMTPKGFIGLQVHGVGKKKEELEVSWRKIRIKVLDEK